MPIIGEADRDALRQRFEESLDQEVTIKLFSESEVRSMLIIPGQTPNPLAKMAKDLAEELAELSPKIKLEVYDVHGDGAEAAHAMGIDRAPVYLLGDDPAGRIRFYGTPVGNEFATIIATVEALSQNTPHLDSNLVAAMERLVEAPVHIQVFVTPTWPHCPRVARAAHAFAMANSRISASVVEVEEFPELAQRYRVMGVPKTVINETTEFTGSVPDELFMTSILQALEKRTNESIEEPEA